jgi:hypothetical protein
LYYHLRQSYSDHRLLGETPGHLFHNYEAADLVTYLQVATLCGFDAHLIPDPTGYARAFLSHDEHMEFAANPNNPQLVKDFAAAFGGSVIAGSEPVVR